MNCFYWVVLFFELGWGGCMSTYFGREMASGGERLGFLFLILFSALPYHRHIDHPRFLSHHHHHQWFIIIRRG